MGHTFTGLFYHCIFGTLGRRNLIPPDDQNPIHGYMAGVLKNIGGLPIRIGGMRDHVHIVCSFRADMSIAEAMRKVKANTTGWIHETFPQLGHFAWQEGYGGFTVSKSNLDAVVRYIENQQEHHKGKTFEQEFLELLTKHGIEYDPQHVFD